VQFDDHEQEVDTLVLPSHTPGLFIQILFRPRISFNVRGLEFAFIAKKLNNKPPETQYWFLPFVKRGVKEKRPDPDHPLYDRDHFVDHHGNYHIVRNQLWSRGNVGDSNVNTSGFVIDTNDVGDYALKVSITTGDGITFVSKMNVRIIDAPFSVEVPCKEKKKRKRNATFRFG
jgi:hypothetical protein